MTERQPIPSPDPLCPCPELPNPPRITLVTPNYNYSLFLEATLRSVLGQKYPNLEYIVIDDGSTDESVAVIRRFAAQLAHWQTGPNQGQYKAISAGFNKSTGEVMGWLNSDDMHLPWTLWAVADIFSSFPEVEWITTLHLGGWDWQGYPTGFHVNRGYSHEAFLDGRYLPTPAVDAAGVPNRAREYIQQESTFWRRSLWDRAGGRVPDEFGSAGDFALWARFFEVGGRLIGVDVPLAGFRFQSQQQTSQIEKYALNCVAALGEARERAKWRGVRKWRTTLFKTHLFDVPRIRGRLARRYGYRGQKLVRANRNTADVSWKLASHNFT